MESPRSPKRRRILASINTTGVDGHDTDLGREVHRKPAISSPPSGPARTSAPGSTRGGFPAEPLAEPAHPTNPDSTERQTSEPRASRVRFKSSRHRRHRDEGDGHHRRRREEDDDHHRRHRDRDGDRHQDREREPHGESSGSKDKDDDRSTRHRHRRHRSKSRSRSRSPKSSSHRHHHRRRERHRHTKRKESQPQEPEPHDPFAEEPLDPEVAFRESLFDAMADDEGAAYWEGVYGQPVHIYSPERLNPQGELERMTEDEYAAYVRQKMWEKTHAGLLEERERRKKQAEERARKEEEDLRIQAEMERSLRRGEKRRAKRAWRDKWDAYVNAWNKWDGKSVEGIPWPVDVSVAADEKDGKKEIDHAAVRAFFVNGFNLEEIGEKEFVAKLKDERVRWHPDKFQQKLGGEVEEGVMRDVTAIFQVIDALWNDTRKSS